MLQKAELIKYRYCGTASVIIYTFLNHLIFFLQIAGKLSFKDQCIYWHNYFRTLHQVNTLHLVHLENCEKTNSVNIKYNSVAFISMVILWDFIHRLKS